MHIGFVVYGSLEQKTGGYLYDKKLVEHLRAAGDHVEVLRLPDRGYLRSAIPTMGKEFLANLIHTPYDAVIVDELCHPSLYAWLDKVTPHQRVVGLVHHLRFSEPAGFFSKLSARWMETRFLNQLHGLLLNSETTKQTCNELLTKSLPCHVMLPAAIHPLAKCRAEEIRARSWSKKPRTLAFLGSVTARKGLDTVLDAMAQIEFPLKLLVLGSTTREPRHAQACMDKAESLSQHAIQFFGESSEENIHHVLGQAHLLAMPSLYEGFGIAYLEGFSAYLPALATRAGGATEIVQDGVNGYLIDPKDSVTLAKRIRHLVDNPAKLCEMSLMARETFDRHPTWEKTFSGVRPFIQQLPHPRREKMPRAAPP